MAVFGAGAATSSLWPRSQAVGTTAIEAPKGDDVDAGAAEPVPVRPADENPPAVHGLPSPEAAGADSAAEGGKNASSTDAGLKASQDAIERENKKIDLKQVVDMLKSGKDELGDDLSPAGRERLERALRDLGSTLERVGSSPG